MTDSHLVAISAHNQRSSWNILILRATSLRTRGKWGAACAALLNSVPLLLSTATRSCCQHSQRPEFWCRDCTAARNNVLRLKRALFCMQIRRNICLCVKRGPGLHGGVSNRPPSLRLRWSLQVWDPVLIVAQILAVQCCFYLGLGILQAALLGALLAAQAHAPPFIHCSDSRA